MRFKKNWYPYWVHQCISMLRNGLLAQSSFRWWLVFCIDDTPVSPFLTTYCRALCPPAKGRLEEGP